MRGEGITYDTGFIHAGTSTREDFDPGVVDRELRRVRRARRGLPRLTALAATVVGSELVGRGLLGGGERRRWQRDDPGGREQLQVVG
jgi:hypothetical protein